MRIRSLTWLLAALLVAVGGTGAGAAAARPRHLQPLRVRSSSLSQKGQQITWRLEMDAPFSPGALAKDGRTLCLLRARVGDGSIAGSLCVYGPKPGQKTPRLFYSPITASGPGRGQRIAATISRSSSKNLIATFLPGEVGTAYVPIRWQVISTVRGAACVPSSGQTRCFDLYPARPVLFKIHVPQVVGCIPSGSSLVFSGPSNVHQIALTFDDGPWDDAPDDRLGEPVRARARSGHVLRDRRPDQRVRPHRGGRAAGARGRRHARRPHLDPSRHDQALRRAQTSELEQTVAAIRNATGFTTCIWRPPYEAFDSQVDSLAASLGLLTINYDVDTSDYTLPGSATIYQRAVSGAHNGAIILQHFGGGPRYETYDAVQQEIPTLRREGYSFVTIPQISACV